VTRNVDEVKDVIFYDRPILENMKNIVMRESDSLQLISLFSIAVTQRGVVTQALPIRISPLLIVKITGKLPHIIPFDRDREYC